MKPERANLIEAVERLKNDSFKTGPNWDACHDLCQSREGSPEYDWVHGLVHLIEGDKANASYWYRRAEKTQSSQDIEREWLNILNELKQD